MKVNPSIPINSLLVALLTGCAGYNNTLFMTKSNVGLDFDSKPPTMEINVSRKEAVIAPSFEGGKTPPVMASFKPSAGAGGSFGSFFMGVDQTFAGGDAALAMSQLYNQPTATDIKKFDSALELSKKPGYTDPFRKIPDAGATRPLIFGTDTSLGLKAAWTGTGGQFPDTVKLGFNRKEFAWAPLSAMPKLNANCDKDGTKVNVKMPAFLATVESSHKLDTNGTRVEALQYFATGDSATYLAMQKDVRAAMHARLDPNSQAFKSRFSAEALDVFSDILFSHEMILAHWAKKGDKMAEAHLNQLNNLKNLGLPTTYRNDSIPVYVFDPSNMLVQKNPGAEITLNQKLAGITGYLSSLEASQDHLTNVIAQIEQNKTVKLQVGPNPSAQNDITTSLVPKLLADLTNLKQRAEKLKEALASNPDVKAADYYVQHKSSSR